MVIYQEGATTVRVCWAHKPFIIAQGEGKPPIKLVGIRLTGDTLRVGLLLPPLEVQWVAPEQYLSADEAARWAKSGFLRTPRR